MPTIRPRTDKAGVTRYQVIVRLRGAEPVSATFERKIDARRWATETEAAIREGRFFQGGAARRHKVSDLIDRYIKDEIPKKPKSGPGQIQQLEWWRRELGELLLSELSPSKIAACRDKLSKTDTVRKKAASAATVNRYLAALSHALSVATKEWQWLQQNPMRAVSKLREPRGRVRFLDDVERNRLLDACLASTNQYLYPITVLAISTGMRQGEILSLQWIDIDFDRSRILLEDTKNGERRQVPLHYKALQELRQMKHQQERLDPFVFPPQRGPQSLMLGAKVPWRPANIRRAWAAAVKEAGLENFRFHDLRHCAASYLARAGATTVEIAEVLGHKTLHMVKRYTHFTQSHTSELVRRMNEEVFTKSE